eukprot:COSAG04_NODE_19565_length_413_cov_0.824841_1_plen_69_part_10
MRRLVLFLLPIAVVARPQQHPGLRRGRRVECEDLSSLLEVDCTGSQGSSETPTGRKMQSELELLHLPSP